MKRRPAHLDRSGEGNPPERGPLGRAEIFSELRENPEALRRLEELMERREFAPGALIFEEGQRGCELFVLVSGDVSIYRDLQKALVEGGAPERYKVAALSSAQAPFFGEGALLEYEYRSATILADQPCECLVLHQKAFGVFSREHPEWAFPILMRIARTVLQRLRKTNDDLTLIYKALVSEVRGN